MLLSDGICLSILLCCSGLFLFFRCGKRVGKQANAAKYSDGPACEKIQKTGLPRMAFEKEK
ncbi:hypothetical protein NEIFLAOT_02406 [Neisseria flavescens NRL30031/H210]|uniref:Uncharacterized protein n=1 Tax=Neisseria flavescens NRL30031/H210 TaxID=546264 RepID=C0ER07_NEIFL|nr:hypothetical protein NEIFLAOT_02406 [Neisseria flavescens NRL30031/H210]